MTKTARKPDGKLDIKTNPQGELTKQQDAFCRHYVEMGNAVQAYRAAYGSQAKATGLFRRIGELQRVPKIQRRMRELREAIADQTVLKVAQILNELRDIALCDPRGLFDEAGAVIPLIHMPRELAAAISAVKVEEVWEWQTDEQGERQRVLAGYVREVKFWNKVEALDRAMKYLGLFERDNRQKNNWLDRIPRDKLILMEQLLSGLDERDSGGAAEPGSGQPPPTAH